MKVVHIISGGDTGGAKTSVITLLLKLREYMTVKLVCFMEGPFTQEARAEGLDILMLPQKNRFDLSVVSALADMIRDEGYDLVNCHGARANFIGSFVKRKVDVPVITTVHSDYAHDFDNSIYKKIIFTLLNRRSLKQMDAYITMAQAFKVSMVERGFDEKKLYVAYNGIHIDEEEKPSEVTAFLMKHPFSYDPRQFYVGMVSRLHPIKGIEVFLQAAKILKDGGSGIKFLLAGSGEEKFTQFYKDYVLQNGLQDTVTFLGFVKDVDSFYSLIHINTLSSHSEAVCYALLEGGRFKKPSVASKVGGTPELINHEKTGLLFADADAQGMAEAILRCYKDQEFANQLGENLYNRIRDEFSDRAMALRYQEIYNELLRGKQK